VCASQDGQTQNLAYQKRFGIFHPIYPKNNRITIQLTF